MPPPATLLLQQVWLLLLLLVLLPAARAQVEPAGSAECPCINPWAALGSGDTRTCRDVTTHRGRHLGEDDVQLCVPLDYGASCQAHDDASFNSECRTTGGDVPDGGAPEWCSSRWCCALRPLAPLLRVPSASNPRLLPDVDPDNCARPTNPSDLVASEGDVTGATCTGTATDGSSTCDLLASTDGTADCPAGCDSEANLVYSYETCGNKNSYDHDRHYAYLRGKHIRVSCA